MEFVLHLFDSARAAIETASSSPEEKSIKTSEANRVLEDRMMAIEQDHRRLNKFVEWRAAIESELADFNENTRNENWFVIHGLPKLDEKDRKLWQEKAKADVSGAILELMGREFPIVFVQNITLKAKDADCRYQVLLKSAAESKEIRDKFGSYFVGGKGDTRPDPIKKFSIQNRITPGTQLRIAILKLLAKRYKASNPGGSAFTIHHESRPLIKINPPEDASDRRQRTFNYVEAIKNLPVNFTQAELRPILEKVNSNLRGTLKQVFVVVSDDMLPRDKFKNKGKGTSGAKSSGPSGPSGPSGTTGSGSQRNSSGNRGEKRGPSVSPESSSSKTSKNSRK